MTVIFKPFLAGIEKRIQEAAAQQACRITDALQEATYAHSCTHLPREYPHSRIREEFWRQTEVAHKSALLAAVQKDIEDYAIKRLKETAAKWEADTFEVVK